MTEKIPMLVTYFFKRCVVIYFLSFFSGFTLTEWYLNSKLPLLLT